MNLKRKLLSWTALPALTLLAAFAVINTIVMPNFATVPYLQSFLITNTATICVTMGVTAAIISGGIDISGGAIVSLVNVSVVYLSSKGMDSYSVFFIGLGIGILCGLLNGIAIGIFRVTPLLVTFATNAMFSGLALWIMPFPGGFFANADYVAMYNSNILIFIPVTALFIIFLLLVWFLFIKGRGGKYLYALGNNEQKAYASAVPVSLIKVFVYAFSGLTAAIGALAITGAFGSADALIGSKFSMTAVSSAVIGGVYMSGGKGDIWGGIFGALFLALITTTVVASHVDSFAQRLVTGLILLAALIGAIMISKLNSKFESYRGLN
jgi:ribose transport system permease protein